MSRSDREALPNVRDWSEALRNVREWLGGPPVYLGVVGRPSGMSGSDQEALWDVLERSGGPPGFTEVVGRLS